jgi:hypothetical protein
MSISRRYVPEHGGLDNCLFACDFSNILAPGIGIMWPGVDSSQMGTTGGGGGIGGQGILLPTPRLEIYTNNQANVTPAAEDWFLDPALAPPAAALTAAGLAAGPWYWWVDPSSPTEQGAQWQPTLPSSSGYYSLGTAVRRREVFSLVGGGDPSVDYLFVWIITDTLGNRWSRTIPVLAGPTS